MSIREKDKKEQRKACSNCEVDCMETCLMRKCPYFVLQNYDEYEERLYEKKGLKILSNWRVKI